MIINVKVTPSHLIDQINSKTNVSSLEYLCTLSIVISSMVYATTPFAYESINIPVFALSMLT